MICAAPQLLSKVEKRVSVLTAAEIKKDYKMLCSGMSEFGDVTRLDGEGGAGRSMIRIYHFLRKPMLHLLHGDLLYTRMSDYPNMLTPYNQGGRSGPDC